MLRPRGPGGEAGLAVPGSLVTDQEIAQTTQSRHDEEEGCECQQKRASAHGLAPGPGERAVPDRGLYRPGRVGSTRNDARPGAVIEESAVPRAPARPDK